MMPRHFFALDRGRLYGTTFEGELLWYGDQRGDGTRGWAPRSGSRIGTGWQDVRLVVPSSGGSFYIVADDGTLRWYRDAAQDGTWSWAQGSGSEVGRGWNDVRLAFGLSGTIYAVDSDGFLRWYRDARGDGTEGWAAGSGNVIGSGWGPVRFAWAGPNRSLYAVNDAGILRWYRDSRGDGMPGWALGSGNIIGEGWQTIWLVAADATGSIYALDHAGRLLWYLDAHNDGSRGWAPRSGSQIGEGWQGFHATVPLSELGHGSITVNGQPTIGTRRLLVVLAEYSNNAAGDFPPFPADPAAHSLSWHRSLAFGTPGPPFSTDNPPNPASLTAFVRENSHDRFRLVPAGSGVVSVNRGDFADGGNPQKRSAEALRTAADSGAVDFFSLDANGDGIISSDELSVLLVENSLNLQPATRRANDVVVSNSTGSRQVTLRVDVSIIGLRTPFYQIIHELMHTLGLGATSDLRGYGDENDLVTIMGGYSFTSDDQRAVHLDGGHKLLLGWIDPRVHSLGRPGEATVAAYAHARPDAPVVLYSPGRRDSLLVEYRSSTNPNTPYDEHLRGAQLNAPREGVGVWRSPGLAARTRVTEHLGSPAADPAVGEPWPAESTTPRLTWGDGANTSVRVRIDAINSTAREARISWWNARCPAILHAVDAAGALRWLRHDGYLIGGGLATWQPQDTSSLVVGSGWRGSLKLISAGRGLLYGINGAGEMRWYRHVGWLDGTDAWLGGHVVGTGWDSFRHLAWVGDGIFYVVTPNGKLLWYRHLGWRGGGGLDSWSSDSGKEVGHGWAGVAHLVAATQGIVYAIMDSGEMRWFRHFGYLSGDGVESWAPGHQVVGRGWTGLSHVVWAGDGHIYAVDSNGVLRWNRHDGWRTGGGLGTWFPQDTSFRPVGIGWQGVQHLAATPL